MLPCGTGGGMGGPACSQLKLMDCPAIFSRMSPTDLDDADASKSFVAVPVSGAPVMSQAPGCWGYLLYDMQEVILGKIPLAELSRLAATCRSFRKFVKHLLRKEQKARSDMALVHFGSTRLQHIAEIIDRCLEGKAAHPGFADNQWNAIWMLACGEVRIESKYSRLTHEARLALYESRAISIWTIRYMPTSPTHLYISWDGHCVSQIDMHIRRREGVTTTHPDDSKRCPSSSPFTISITPRSNEDLHEVALLQALMSGGYGPAFCNGGQRPEIRMRLCHGSGNGDPHQGVGLLETQIAPLQPFASKFTAFGWDRRPIRLSQPVLPAKVPESRSRCESGRQKKRKLAKVSYR